MRGMINKCGTIWKISYLNGSGKVDALMRHPRRKPKRQPFSVPRSNASNLENDVAGGKGCKQKTVRFDRQHC